MNADEPPPRWWRWDDLTTPIGLGENRRIVRVARGPDISVPDRRYAIVDGLETELYPDRDGVCARRCTESTAVELRCIHPPSVGDWRTLDGE